MSEATTEGLHIHVESRYLAARSDPAQGFWMYTYHVTLTNRGHEDVQLLSRHWIITNAHGVEEHVRGPGVIGEFPVLAPGETFEYTSFCPLDTPMGTMHGSYQMVNKGGTRFDAIIAPFTLAEPYTLN